MLSIVAIVFLVSCGKSKPQTIVDSSTPFVQVDSMPVFSRYGDAELLKYLAENTMYPEDAKKNNIEGKVVLRFVVDTDGKVSDVTILSGVNPSINAEAFRVVVSLPKFEKPGYVKGQPVKTYYMVPITFDLK